MEATTQCLFGSGLHSTVALYVCDVLCAPTISATSYVLNKVTNKLHCFVILSMREHTTAGLRNTGLEHTALVCCCIKAQQVHHRAA